jgi:uncharacterized protein YdhG (YjbR/CyaY superfamily)
MDKIASVKDYISGIPSNRKAGFIELHETILAAAPGAESCISYSMPAIKLHGIVVYYACWENHMAIYPMPSALKSFAKDLAAYETSKSTIQFPHGKPIPGKLIRDIVEFRVRENTMKREAKVKKGRSNPVTPGKPRPKKSGTDK